MTRRGLFRAAWFPSAPTFVHALGIPSLVRVVCRWDLVCTLACCVLFSLQLKRKHRQRKNKNRRKLPANDKSGVELRPVGKPLPAVPTFSAKVSGKKSKKKRDKK
mgnify:CR=1 FL=1